MRPPDLPLLHRITVSEYQAGTTHRWRACLAASCVVGRYDKGATLSLASDLCLSVSQVENLAHAGWGWRVFRKFGITSATRNRLTPSHFCACFDLWRELEFDPWEAAEILTESAQHGASVAAMRDAIEGKFGPDRGDMWRRRLGRVVKQVGLLCADYGVPEGVRDAAKQFITAINHNGASQHENPNYNP